MIVSVFLLLFTFLILPQPVFAGQPPEGKPLPLQEWQKGLTEKYDKFIESLLKEEDTKPVQPNPAENLKKVLKEEPEKEEKPVIIPTSSVRQVGVDSPEEIERLKKKAIEQYKASVFIREKNGKVRRVYLSKDRVEKVRSAVGYSTLIRLVGVKVSEKNVLIGNEGKFDVKVYQPDASQIESTNIIITPLSPFVITNLIVFVEETPYFFNITEVFDENEIDYSVEVEIGKEKGRSIDELIEALVFDRSLPYTRAVGLKKEPVVLESKTKKFVGKKFETGDGRWGYIIEDENETIIPQDADYYTRHGSKLIIIYETAKRTQVSVFDTDTFEPDFLTEKKGE